MVGSCKDALFDVIQQLDELLDMDELADSEFDELNDIKHKLEDVYEEA